LLLPQDGQHLIAGQLLARPPQPRGLADGDLDLLRAPLDRVQRCKPNAVGEALLDLRAGLDGQAGLAYAARPHDGDEAIGGIDEQVEQARLLSLTAPKAVRLQRQIIGRRGRLRRRKPTVANLLLKSSGLFLRLDAQFLPQHVLALDKLGQSGVAVATLVMGFHNGPVGGLQPGFQGQLTLGHVQRRLPFAPLPARIPQSRHGLQGPLRVMFALG